MKRDLATVAVLWLILTLAGEAVAGTNLFPQVRADKGEEVKEAFVVLMRYAVPVFALVVSALVYSVLRFRSAGPPREDGPPLFGRGPVPLAWFGITSALAVAVMVYPGLTGLSSVMKDEPNPDLVVRVLGTRWAWVVSYPEHGVMSMQELVLPVDKRVRFEITAADVIHSFWIPAFLMKVDAVPGLTTKLSLRPTQLGSYQQDEAMRLQCAELCGRDHAVMALPVRVVTDREFTEWLGKQPKAAGGFLAPAAATPTPAGAHSGHAP